MVFQMKSSPAVYTRRSTDEQKKILQYHHVQLHYPETETEYFFGPMSMLVGLFTGWWCIVCCPLDVRTVGPPHPTFIVRRP
jgi:hypothetical protein